MNYFITNELELEITEKDKQLKAEIYSRLLYADCTSLSYTLAKNDFFIQEYLKEEQFSLISDLIKQFSISFWILYKRNQFSNSLVNLFNVIDIKSSTSYITFRDRKTKSLYNEGNELFSAAIPTILFICRDNISKYLYFTSIEDRDRFYSNLHNVAYENTLKLLK